MEFLRVQKCFLEPTSNALKQNVVVSDLINVLYSVKFLTETIQYIKQKRISVLLLMNI